MFHHHGRLCWWLLLLLLLVSGAQALAPPMYYDQPFESVHAYRRRLNITYHYEPDHIHAEHCRYISEDECRAYDETVRSAVHESRSSKTKGEFKILVLLCRFSDHTDRELPTRDYFDELFNGEGESAINPVGSIKEWLYFSSMGQYNVEFLVQDWETVTNDEAYYSAGVSGIRPPEQVQEVFKQILSTLYQNGKVDFFDLDSGGWGVLDHLVVIHSGVGAELGVDNEMDPSGCINPQKDRLWSQGTSATGSFGAWNSPDFAYTVSPFVIAGAFDPPLCSFTPASMGILAHEFMHGFGLFDLYDYDNDEDPIYVGGTGRFDIMSNTFGWKRDLNYPGHMSPFSRAAAGWLEPIEITQNGLYPIQASEISNQIYVISEPYPEGEYLYIENRQPVKWDLDWPAGGIVIYHIDEKADRQRNRGYPGHANFPEQHYQVSVLQADGKYGIEKGESPGDAGDFWQRGKTLGADDSEWPNTNSYQGSVYSTGIKITVMTPNALIMTFAVTGFDGRSGSTNDNRMGTLEDPSTAGGTMVWLLSVVVGVAAMMGLLWVIL